jgi:hypothetical protein
MLLRFINNYSFKMAKSHLNYYRRLEPQNFVLIKKASDRKIYGTTAMKS